MADVEEHSIEITGSASAPSVRADLWRFVRRVGARLWGWLAGQLKQVRPRQNGRDALWYGFEEFQLCPAERVLLRSGRVINLTPRTFDVLALLVEEAPSLVTTDQLIAKVWKVQRLELANISQQIHIVRKALTEGPSEEKDRHIENVPRIGYRFVTPVERQWRRWKPGGVEQREGERGRRARVLRWTAALLALVCLATVAKWSSTPLQVAIVGRVPVTQDGRQKTGPLLTDGHVVIFGEAGQPSRLMTVASNGGTAQPLSHVPRGAVPSDLSADGKELLYYRSTLRGHELSSVALAGGTPKFVGNERDGAWSPDGKELVFSTEGKLTLLRPRKEPFMLKIDRRSSGVRWSPRGDKIRFDAEAADGSVSIWEAAVDDSGLHSVKRYGDGQQRCCGVWDAEGRYFFYREFSREKSQIWVAEEHGPLWGLLPARRAQVTPATEKWRYPLAVKQNKRIFAVRDTPKPEMVFLDATTKEWRPYGTDEGATELDFARDGETVAYTRYPDHTLWVRRAQSQRAMQLTLAGLEAHQPHWSPDGRWIAFRGRQRGGPFQVYIMPGNGDGTAIGIWPSSSDQGVPTWSQDGSQLFFGDSPSGRAAAYLRIHMFDVRTGAVSDVAQSQGLWNARMSPDGRHLLALSADRTSLYVKAYPDGEWTQVLRMVFVDNPGWSGDSRSIVFNGRPDFDHMQLFRVAANGPSKPEMIADLEDFRWMPENWFGVTPKGVPIGFHDGGKQDIVALDYELHE